MNRIAVLIIVLALGVSYPCAAKSATAHDIIRIHVMAHNDTHSEQEVKLKVRDAVLEFVTPLLAEATDSGQASEIIKTSLRDIKAIAEKALMQSGSDHVVDMQWGTFLIPTRVYGQSALPAGRYQALNIHIGSGEGKNWWCVMYPPLCYVDGVVGSGQGLRYELAIVSWLRMFVARILP